MRNGALFPLALQNQIWNNQITILTSSLFALLSAAAMYLCRLVLKTDTFLTDVGGLGAFLTVFGTLYGIMAAFVVFEVWSQYNKTIELIDKEALGLEGLFRLTLYFRDKKLTARMKQVIRNYADLVIEGKFQKLGSGERNEKTGKVFREIARVIQDIKFNDDHDQVVFHHITDHFRNLSETRTARITQSLARLPTLLKIFLYASSLVALLTFILMPFQNVYYGLLASGSLGFILAMIFQLVEDLDNPFVGHWNVTPEPFSRALKHIEEDYN